MNIVEVLNERITVDNVDYVYNYRVITSEYNGINAYGIEVERIDYKDDVEYNLERDDIKLISTDIKKVQELNRILYNNLVSPLHLVDVIGEYADLYVEDFKFIDELTLAI